MSIPVKPPRLGGPDIAHGAYPDHYDLMTKLPFGSDKTRVDKGGNVIDGTTEISARLLGLGKGAKKLKW